MKSLSNAQWIILSLVMVLACFLFLSVSGVKDVNNRFTNIHGPNEYIKMKQPPLTVRLPILAIIIIPFYMGVSVLRILRSYPNGVDRDNMDRERIGGRIALALAGLFIYIILRIESVLFYTALFYNS